MIESEGYFKYWAKADPDVGDKQPRYHLVPYHNLDVAAVGYCLLNSDKSLVNRLCAFHNMPSSQLVDFITLLLAWHDLGKFTEGFQNLVPDLFLHLNGKSSTQRYLLRHDTAGLIFVRSYKGADVVLRNNIQKKFTGFDEDEPTKFEILNPSLNSIFGHHGLPPDLGGNYSVDVLYPESSTSAAEQFIEDTYVFLAKSPIALGHDYDLQKTRVMQSSWILAGFATFCDWIGSNSALFEFVDKPMLLPEYWKSYAIPQAEYAIRKLKILPTPSRGFVAIGQTCPNIMHPTPLQSLCGEMHIQQEPSLYIIEDTTGAGKTEAALCLAHRLIAANQVQSVFFALPTMATANGVFKRVSDMYLNIFAPNTSPSLVLAHSRSALNQRFQEILNVEPTTIDVEALNGIAETEIQAGEANCAAWFADTSKKSLLASFGVGTIDQALVGVLPLKHQSLRLFGASRSVLILDEVHAYDSYMAQLIERLLEFQGGFNAPVILMSATLPRHMKDAFSKAYLKGRGQNILPNTLQENPYPSLDVVSVSNCTRATFKTRDEVRRTVTVEYYHDKSAIINTIKEVTRQGKSVCWIRNTINDALEAFEEFKTEVGQDKLTLFHSRFCHGDRQRIEDKVLSIFGDKSTTSQRSGQLLIATQVIEQSLDLDFDLMITDLAPIDLIIQRAGRLMRHTRDKNGNRIFGADERGTPKLVIYGPKFTDQPQSDWYESFSRPASFVYKHHGKLYLTAKILIREGCLRAPDDFRSYVEEVYGNTSDDDIPSALEYREQKAVGIDSGAKSLAMINGLSVLQGYDMQNSNWSKDVDTPTRLSEDQYQVTLVISKNGRLYPLFNGENAWELSEVRLPGKYKPLPDTPAIIELKEKPQHKWRNFVVIEEQSDYYSGQVMTRKNKLVDFKYDPVIGLHEVKDEDL
jgi:CRISPR-associated endonuclease/helicase Cas3